MLDKRTPADEDDGIPTGEDIVAGFAGSELQIPFNTTGAGAHRKNNMTNETSHLLTATDKTSKWTTAYCARVDINRLRMCGMAQRY